MDAVKTPVRVLGERDANRENVAADDKNDKNAKQTKKTKLSALCRTPPSLIKGKKGEDYRRGTCLGEVCIDLS
jgi:hypothetical protein